MKLEPRSYEITKPRRVNTAGSILVRAAWIAAWLAGLSANGWASETTEAAHRIGVTDAAPGGILEIVLFYGVGGAAAVCAVGVAVSKNIVRMAVWLFGALGSVAMLYFMLSANFLGAIQLIVYVGGTLVLLIFGVMLTSKSPWVRFEPRKWEFAAALVVCVSLMGALGIVLRQTAWYTPEGVVPGASVADLGRRLLTTYLIPFEVAGVLLFIVMVGAAHLARQEES